MPLKSEQVDNPELWSGLFFLAEQCRRVADNSTQGPRQGSKFLQGRMAHKSGYLAGERYSDRLWYAEIRIKYGVRMGMASEQFDYDVTERGLDANDRSQRKAGQAKRNQCQRQ